MSGLQVRRAAVADVEQMARLHIAASRRAYAGIVMSWRKPPAVGCFSTRRI